MNRRPFPVIADPTYRGTIYKTETINLDNTYSDICKLEEMINDINDKQNANLPKILSHINNVFALFNIYTGVFSLGISGCIQSYYQFLESCEDTYSKIMTYFAKGGNCAKINYNYVGTYQGKNKGYVYKIRSVDYELR